LAVAEDPIDELVSMSFPPILISFIADLEVLMAYLLLVTLSIFFLTVSSDDTFWKSLEELGIKTINVTTIIPIKINLPIKRLFVFRFS
jgi:hypothetical protein